MPKTLVAGLAKNIAPFLPYLKKSWAALSDRLGEDAKPIFVIFENNSNDATSTELKKWACEGLYAIKYNELHVFGHSPEQGAAGLDLVAWPSRLRANAMTSHNFREHGTGMPRVTWSLDEEQLPVARPGQDRRPGGGARRD
jgi:hypothetical protein